METVVVVGLAVLVYFIIELNGKMDRQSRILEEQSDKLSVLEDKLFEVQSELGNIEAAIETITPDSARVDEMVRLGIDRGDAWEYILTKGKNKEL